MDYENNLVQKSLEDDEILKDFRVKLSINKHVSLYLIINLFHFLVITKMNECNYY
jgi:hypothetical protein